MDKNQIGNMSIRICIETQLRAGTHYLLANLLKLYHCIPAIVTRSGNIDVKDFSWLNMGLYDPIECSWQDSNQLVVQSHFYSPKAKELRTGDYPVIYQIGFPIDSYISDGMVYKAYTDLHPGPSQKNPYHNDYRLCYDSTEFKTLKEYMIQNAEMAGMDS